MGIKSILLDTRSIQKYIFSGNKLKTNIGASYMVEQIFEDLLVDKILREQFQLDIPNYEWKLPSEDITSARKITNSQCRCEIASIGGGKAILFLREDENTGAENAFTARNLVKAWTRKLMVYAPGLKTGVAISDMDLDNVQQSIDELFLQLKTNQNNIFPNVALPYTGLTLECKFSGDAANCYYTDYSDEGRVERYISAEAMAKLAKADKATQALYNKFRDVVDEDNYAFTDDIGNLGQPEGENYIAIVHIDGNNMGAKFAACESLEERKALSIKVAEYATEAFKKLMAYIVAEYPEYEKSELFVLKKTEKGKAILPIRPIIIGGDDITFVCPGRLGIAFAKKYMEILQTMGKLPLHPNTKYQNDKGEDCLDDGVFYTCAGVAILSTSYPFFRGYQLAEQLCSAAKQESRKKASSWLDYAILNGEQAPTLAQIRAQEYTGALGNLHFGPYLIADIQEKGSIERLLTGARAFEKYPRNKVKELRDVIRKGEHAIGRYVEQLGQQRDERFKQIPRITGLGNYDGTHTAGGNNQCTLWDKGRTPYLDMIEIIDFMFPAKEDK